MAFQHFGYESDYYEQLFFDLQITTRVLRKDNTIAGSSMHQRLGRGVELVAIMVAEGHGRMGVGSRLLRSIIVEAHQSNFPLITLHTAEQNFAARAFFESHGFSTNQNNGHYPRGQRAVGYELLL